MLRKAMATYKANISLSFTEVRLVKLISSEVPHQFSIRMCEVTFDRGNIYNISPIIFDFELSDLDSLDNSELMQLWKTKLKSSLDYWNNCAEVAFSKPLLEVTLKD